MRKKVLLPLVLLFVTLGFNVSEASFEKREARWRDRQKKVVKTVLVLTRLGTRFPAFRCGLYVPGKGVCYMKMTRVKMPSTSTSSGKASPPLVADIAEIIEVGKRIGRAKVLAFGERLYMQSRFLNHNYLRILPKELVDKIAGVKKKNLLAYKKMMSDITTYLDGNCDGKEVDVWISETTERFSTGKMPVYLVKNEGVIIPHNAIILYQKYPGLRLRKGEKGMADKLYSIFSDSKGLIDYYKGYVLAVGLESDGQLIYASYPITRIQNLKRGELKYFRYNPSLGKKKK